jgi:hypothetical protein
MRPAMHAPVSGAEKTVLAAGLADESGHLASLSEARWRELSLDWPRFWSVALKNSERDFEGAEVRLHRDARRVIRYTEIYSSEGRAPSLVLAPSFFTSTARNMGDSFLLVVPSRFQCFVFPKLVGDVSQYAEIVHDAYRKTAYPVSTELFECSKGGLWTVGCFERP